MIGRNIEEMIPPQALGPERARHARVAAGSAESGIHCTRMRVDGTPIDVVMSMSPVRDRRGAVVGMASISRPVSDDERSDARFRSLLEAAPDAIVVRRPFRPYRHRQRPGQPHLRLRAGRRLIGSPVELLLPEQVRAGHVAHREKFTDAPRQRPMGAGLATLGASQGRFGVSGGSQPLRRTSKPMTRSLSPRYAMSAGSGRPSWRYAMPSPRRRPRTRPRTSSFPG